MAGNAEERILATVAPTIFCAGCLVGPYGDKTVAAGV